jgi:tetratricopeptide (TPR) repeat protein
VSLVITIAKTVNAGIKNLANNYAGALTELQEVEAFYNKGEGQMPEPRFYTEKARAYLGLKKYNDAIQTINAVKVGRNKRIIKMFQDNYDILSKAYEGIGDYKNALKNYRLHVQAEDTLAVWRNSSETTTAGIGEPIYSTTTQI